MQCWSYVIHTSRFVERISDILMNAKTKWLCYEHVDDTILVPFHWRNDWINLSCQVLNWIEKLPDTPSPTPPPVNNDLIKIKTLTAKLTNDENEWDGYFLPVKEYLLKAGNPKICCLSTQYTSCRIVNRYKNCHKTALHWRTYWSIWEITWQGQILDCWWSECWKCVFSNIDFFYINQQ